jgi:hypothetical protein
MKKKIKDKENYVPRPCQNNGTKAPNYRDKKEIDGQDRKAGSRQAAQKPMASF